GAHRLELKRRAIDLGQLVGTRNDDVNAKGSVVHVLHAEARELVGDRSRFGSKKRAFAAHATDGATEIEISGHRPPHSIVQPPASGMRSSRRGHLIQRAGPRTRYSTSPDRHLLGTRPRHKHPDPISGLLPGADARRDADPLVRRSTYR